uniref:tyrosine--tRNA ligase n=1 Tax=Aegilops tauschii TaxID=37682 RepID=R7WDW7_AEGTA
MATNHAAIHVGPQGEEDHGGPPRAAKSNPCLEYVSCVVFPWLVDFEVAREKDVGVRTFRSVGRFVEEYKRGKLDPGDVKHAMAINKMLKPVRGHIGSDTSLCVP